MADDIPVSDVLCEAMEYLSKLGSNLRSRSESLKEKKISKEKLKNFHAVKKAANKVLLICDLSKKSLENVETGIRKVLDVAAKQGRDNTSKGERRVSSENNHSSSKKHSDKHIDIDDNVRSLAPKKYHYFEYRSRKLKIAKRISVKHYTSVKVMARRIPSSMLEHYPVYYNCALYRLRKEQARKEKEDRKQDLSDTENEDSKSNAPEVRKEQACKEKKNQKQDLSDRENEDSKSDTPELRKEQARKEKEYRKHDLSDRENEDSKSDAPEVNRDHLFSLKKSKNGERLHSVEKIGTPEQAADEVKSENDEESSKKTYKIREEEKTSEGPKSHEQSPNKSNSSGDESTAKKKKIKNRILITDESSDEEKKHSRKMSDKQRSPRKKHKSNRKPKIDSDSSEDEKTSAKQRSPRKKKSNRKPKIDSDGSEDERTSKKRNNKHVSDDSTDENKVSDEPVKQLPHKKSQIIISDSSGSGDESVTRKKKLKSQGTIDDNSDDEKKTLFINSSDDEKKEIKDKSKSSQAEVISRKESHNDESESKKADEVKAVDSGQQENSVPHRPLIKLVSMSKLLKSEIVQSMEQEKKCSNQSRQEGAEKYKSESKKERNTNKEKTKKKVTFAEEDDFWLERRKLVKSFEPKEFSICLARLLELTPDFLKVHGVSKMIGIDKADHIQPEVIDKVKNALLNDSDSEESDNKKNENKKCKSKKSSNNSDEVKKSLLVDSDSEKSDDEQKQLTKVNKSSKKSMNSSDSTRNDEDNSVINEDSTEKCVNSCKSKDDTAFAKKNDKESNTSVVDIKKSLLNDSDSDEIDNQGNKSPNNRDRTESPSDKISKKIKDSLLEESDNEDRDKSRKSKSPSIEKSYVDSKQIKDSLLQESDNDDQDIIDSAKKHADAEKSCRKSESPSTEKSTVNSEQIKDSLLQESDNEDHEMSYKDKNHSVSRNVHPGESNTSSNPNLDESDKNTEKNAETHQDLEESEQNITNDDSNTKSTENVEPPNSPNLGDENAKSPLPRDSSGDSKNNKTDSVKKSMHAKRMLLNHSSSSESETENLKQVKKVKSALLSSDEDTQAQGNKKKVSSSDSDDDIVSKRKGRKTFRESDSSDDSIRIKRKKRKTFNESPSPSKKDVSGACSSDENESSSRKMGRSSEKPGSSSGQSDNQDEKEIKGLTNLKTLNTTRRRGEDSNSNKESNSRGLKTKHIKGQEGLLEASSSVEASSAESDACDEELPSISLSGLNGSAMEHLAKDDLLGESDSDASKDKDKSDDDVQKEDESDDDNVKSKRRKANTISSDSEAGSSKRKDRKKFSDFEDSEDESSEAGKKKKKRKKEVDSDASSAGSASSTEGSKKKRRRIKQIKDSDASDSDDEAGGKNKHGRKNIRKVMGKNQLEEATKKAARQEKERLARILERQKTYNNLEFDESGKPDEVVLDKVVLDFDPETKEPLIEVDRGLVKKLKPHQANGIKFMWDACFESVKRIKKDRGSGCILAHCMGLGKTLQVVSLTHTLLTNSELTRVNRVLVVCPLSTVLNWVNEFKMWLKYTDRDYEVDVYELSRFKQNSERAFQLSQWFTHGGVCVLGYEMFRNLSADNNKKFKKKMLRQFQESLVDPGPDLVVCDEGHLLKNEKTSLSQSMNRVKTLRRIVLTGTPLQNNLKEYYCMVQFVKPNLLGKYNEYLNRFVNPITNGQYTDSTEQDIRVMKRRSHVLHKMLDGAVQRRDYSVLAPFLPPKHEYVLFITLTDVQIKLYEHYLDNYSRRPLPGKSSGFLFPDFQSLQRIWTHPLVLKYNSERYEIMQQKKRDKEEEDSEGSLVDFIDDDSTPEESSTEESTEESDLSDDSRKKSKKKKSNKKGKATGRRGTRANPVEQLEEEPVMEVVEAKNDNPTEWWIPMVTEDEIEDMRNSHKLVLLFEILRQCEAIGDKVLVFSQSLYSLDLIEHFLGKVDEATQEARIDEKLGGHVGSWSPGIDYFRLDGSTSCENRSIWCKNFNREDNPRARLFLISTRAGGLGINLVAANRVIIFDVSWNPSHDVQSIFRVYRFGQKKPCYVYRFLAMGTMEEKIYERQVTKQAISKRVIDEQQIDRHYAEHDLTELYKFEPRPPEPRPVPNVPKDRLFAEMLKEHENAIYKFHEHDSLLENKEEETLSEEERKAAWEDFENEKNRPPPAPFPNWSMMQNGMGTMPMLQQQQQLAYAAVAAMLRKDMPNVTDDQIRSMLPLIYGANPGMFGGYDYGLMQKLNDMYKYAQPGMMNPMMNPAMMNPVMNAGVPAGGVGGVGGVPGVGAGGSSGLQYEPPWQRQQQQQQQMRLQQLLQHQQNPMGAKLYAGGLGSRDPVAMALQAQRSRELLLGERRPRGRPPLQRPAPTSTQDVVNLDSD